MKSKIKIGLADDHPIFRRGLSTVISAENNLDLIWEAEDGKEVLTKTEENPPDVLILDIDMPVLDGLQTAKQLNAGFPETEIIFLTMHKDSQIFDSMKSYNVKGYVLKDSALDEIAESIKKVFAGQTYLTPELTEILLDSGGSKNTERDSLKIISALTAAEKRIMFLISDSKTSKEIAEELFISVRTVENHRFNICKKLKLKGNHALLKFTLAKRDTIKNLLIE